jgi:type IV secretion system protein VirD4
VTRRRCRQCSPPSRCSPATPHLGEAGVHSVVASSARELLNKSDNERSGVLSTAMSFLGLYRDPVVATVTRRCDWRIHDLLGHQPHQAARAPDP